MNKTTTKRCDNVYKPKLCETVSNFFNYHHIVWIILKFRESNLSTKNIMEQYLQKLTN